MRSSSLPKSKTRSTRTPSLDPLVQFDGWYRARSEPARHAQGWTPEAMLHADYVRFVGAVSPDDQPMALPAFRAALGDKLGAETAKRMVSDGVHEELADCWNRALMRPIRVAA